MHEKQIVTPDNTAVRVALWRALHVETFPPPMNEVETLTTTTGLLTSSPLPTTQSSAFFNKPEMLCA
jgi:hypothetical protein